SSAEEAAEKDPVAAAKTVEIELPARPADTEQEPRSEEAKTEETQGTHTERTPAEVTRTETTSAKAAATGVSPTEVTQTEITQTEVTQTEVTETEVTDLEVTRTEGAQAEETGTGPAGAARPSSGAEPTRAEKLPVLPEPQPSAEPQSPAQQEAQPQAGGAPGQWSVPWHGDVAPVAAAPETPAPAEPEKPRRGRTRIVVLVAALVLVAGVVTGQLVRPVPEPSVDLVVKTSVTFPGQAPALPLPDAGQAAVHVEGLGTMGSSGGAEPIPTASVAKVMTAYVYLRDHPLRPGEAGPVLTVSPEGAAEIPMREQRGESILGVTANQRITQRKALEALLVISANDIAHELARWDSGSTEAFVAKMNTTAASLGMTSTHYTDPSGYDPGTVSTAADQVKLLREAMRIPAFAEIVNMPRYVPDDGGPARQGGNFLLGRHGVVGGKTGYTDKAGGNFVFAARKDVQGVKTLIVGAVMGQRTPSAAGAIDVAQRLVVAAGDALTATRLASQGAVVGRVDDGLGDTTPLRAASPVTVVGWPGLTVPVTVSGDVPREADGGERVATLTAGAAKVPLRLARTLEKPSIVERLIRLG
ncbi:MAG TPA: hypothetical protein VIL71_24160, partial [Spirillospora sp.]